MSTKRDSTKKQEKVSTQKGNIYLKKMKDGKDNVMVRFSYDKKNYPVKNFTKLFGSKNITEAKNKLAEVKVLISKGVNPFITTPDTLNSVWKEFVELKISSESWKVKTTRTYTNQYDKWIKKSIGWKKFDKVTKKDITLLFNKMSHLGNSSKSFVKLLLQDLFNYAMKLELIQKNILIGYSFKRTKSEKRKIVNILIDEPKVAIRKIFKAISEYEPQMKKFHTEEVRASFYLLLMTAHRAEEILSLREEHVLLNESKFVSTPDITKTKEYYHFPIPLEVKEFIETSLTKREELFPNMIRETLLKRWKEMISLSDIKLHHNQVLTMHDTRRLMLSVMINDCGVDGFLADYCLNHKPNGILQHYLSFSYKNVEEAYQKFWKVIRGEEIEVKKPNLDDISLEDIPKELIPMILAYKNSK